MKVKRTGEIYTSEPNESLRLISDAQFEFADEIIKSRITTRRRKGNFPEGVTKVSVCGASLLSGILYCAHCGHKLVGNYTEKKRGSTTTYRPIYRCYSGATRAKNCDGQQTYSARKIEDAVLSDVRQYFSTISAAVDDEWKTQARKRIRSNALARQKAAEARLLKLQKDQKGLKSEIMKSINGESAFDTDLLKEMMDVQAERDSGQQGHISRTV